MKKVCIVIWLVVSSLLFTLSAQDDLNESLPEDDELNLSENSESSENNTTDIWYDQSGSCYYKGLKSAAGGFSLGYFGVFASIDYGVHDIFSAGAAIGINGYDYSLTWRAHHFPIVARAAFHPFNLTVLKDKISVRDKLDVYAGLQSGFVIGWTTKKTPGPVLAEPDVGGFSFREYLGAKYYMNENLFFMVEEASGVAWLTFGAGYCF